MEHLATYETPGLAASFPFAALSALSVRRYDGGAVALGSLLSPSSAPPAGARTLLVLGRNLL